MHREDIPGGGITFKWAWVCKTDEETEMIEWEFQSAAIPGEPYGLQFDGITQYKPGNQDNLQVGNLEDVHISGTSPQHCIVRMDALALDVGGGAEFNFTEWSVLIAPERSRI